jgi:hypothetical protein
MQPADGSSIHVKFELEHSVLLDRREDGAGIRTDQFSYTKIVEPGEPIKLRMGKPSDKQTWVELKVQPLP